MIFVAIRIIAGTLTGIFFASATYLYLLSDEFFGGLSNLQNVMRMDSGPFNQSISPVTFGALMFAPLALSLVLTEARAQRQLTTHAVVGATLMVLAALIWRVADAMELPAIRAAWAANPGPTAVAILIGNITPAFIGGLAGGFLYWLGSGRIAGVSTHAASFADRSIAGAFAAFVPILVMEHSLWQQFAAWSAGPSIQDIVPWSRDFPALPHAWGGALGAMVLIFCFTLLGAVIPGHRKWRRVTSWMMMGAATGFAVMLALDGINFVNRGLNGNSGDITLEHFVNQILRYPIEYMSMASAFGIGGSIAWVITRFSAGPETQD